jgi:hypothetical protein
MSTHGLQNDQAFPPTARSLYLDRMDPVLGIIGAFVLALPIAVLVYTHKHNQNQAAKPIPWEAAGAVIGVMAAIGGAFLAAGLAIGGTIGKEDVREAVPGPTVTVTAMPSPPAGPDTGPLVASIDKPSNGERVEGEELPVFGHVQGLLPSSSIWCFVVDDGDRWYPYRASVDTRGGWHALVGIGPPVLGAGPLQFDLHVVSAAPEAAEKIRVRLRDSEDPEYDGLAGLPAGASSLESVSILRVK